MDGQWSEASGESLLLLPHKPKTFRTTPKSQMRERKIIKRKKVLSGQIFYENE